jgi:hypothetical protein
MEKHPINLAVLRHVSLYRVTLQECVQRLFFPKGQGSEAGTVLKKLSSGDQPSLCSHSGKNGLPRQVTYYTLTPKGAKEIGARSERAERFGGEALRTHLATLWFCGMGAKRAHRLQPEELDEIFGETGLVHANTAHCIAREKDGPRLYRVYPASSGTKKTVGYLKEVLEAIITSPEKKLLRQWIEQRDYGFAVLGPTPEACDDLSRALHQKDTGLFDQAHFIVRLGPSPETIRDALNIYRDGLP